MKNYNDMKTVAEKVEHIINNRYAYSPADAIATTTEKIEAIRDESYLTTRDVDRILGQKIDWNKLKREIYMPYMSDDESEIGFSASILALVSNDDYQEIDGHVKISMDAVTEHDIEQWTKKMQIEFLKADLELRCD